MGPKLGSGKHLREIVYVIPESTEDERRSWGNLYLRSYEGKTQRCRLGEKTKFRVSENKHIRPNLKIDYQLGRQAGTGTAVAVLVGQLFSSNNKLKL